MDPGFDGAGREESSCGSSPRNSISLQISQWSAFSSTHIHVPGLPVLIDFWIDFVLEGEPFRMSMKFGETEVGGISVKMPPFVDPDKIFRSRRLQVIDERYKDGHGSVEDSVQPTACGS